MKHLTSLFIPFILYACSTSSAGDASESEAAETARLSYVEPSVTEVGTVTARKADFELELVSNGRLEAQRKAVVPFRVQEQIDAVYVMEGETVSAGQVLGSVDPFTYQKRMDDANNRYLQALIDLEDRLLGYGHQLSDTAQVPENIMKMARIRSGYNAAAIAVEEAKRNLEQTTIKAPVGGVVTNLEARIHNPSNAFQKFCEILDLNTMHLVFHLLETELSGIKNGQTVELTPFALPGESFRGRVTSINPAVDERGMVRITATVPNPGHRLMDGMNARVLLKNSIPDCLVIPKEAVLYRQNRQVVFIYENGKAIWKYVETSHENSTHVTITDGLEEGMEVIFENNLNLAHESQVTRR
ncbi:efflux RND transporter periplasmic adaptor subunit [Alkalitalea saponilacus]|uniref:RND family efflux transporter, MFP subunit n=1 Tax=Alkalitalea saponilacus TaxID=889453 RepID=A0A1T5GFM0_9BACT|nr:efflux RND transporter periplasmic adaptor subunit [Alkalitalea saponilacus]ASB47955.1 efflux RND transporter periplasmic adaptor subunit [Alkalitalea saponilacus]SKC07170.1 RND family efflux transporter, MFP subunit [Alkalitalea saponilacus]